jgi:hypothetical protein
MPFDADEGKASFRRAGGGRGRAKFFLFLPMPFDADEEEASFRRVGGGRGRVTFFFFSYRCPSIRDSDEEKASFRRAGGGRGRAKKSRCWKGKNQAPGASIKEA